MPSTFDSADLRAIVLVEGISDQVALETLARRRGLNLDAERISVEAIGGAQAVGRFLTRLGEQRTDVRLGGLCDVAEKDDFRRGLERAGFGSHLSDPDMGFEVAARLVDYITALELVRRGTDPPH